MKRRPAVYAAPWGTLSPTPPGIYRIVPKAKVGRSRKEGQVPDVRREPGGFASGHWGGAPVASPQSRILRPVRRPT